jgi:hypothetical protein
MERVKGIEPSYSAWKAAALPLSYTRKINELASFIRCDRYKLGVLQRLFGKVLGDAAGVVEWMACKVA